MKKIIVIIIVFLSTSCSKDLVDLNVDTKNATTASGETFFTFGVKSLLDIISAPAYGDDTMLYMAQLWAQQVTLVTYTNPAQYYFDGMWSDMYANVLKNLNESHSVLSALEPIDDAQAAQIKNQLAIIEIMQVQAMSMLVDTFGDVPYSEALDYENVLPKYDDGKTIYLDIIARLDAAIAAIDSSAPGFDKGDPIYSGNAAMWLKYAQSLKLKLGLRIIDVEPQAGKQAVIEAAPHAFTSNADNAVMPYLDATPNTNPLWINLELGNRKDVVIAEPFVDTLNVREDPRRDIFFTKINGNFVGAEYGQVVLFDDFSNYGSLFRDPKLPGILMDYAQVEFLLAEAAERSLIGTPADAEDHYNKAIEASFEYYNVEGVSDYLSNPLVNYTTATGDWKQKIGTQKWIALFNQGFEAWTEYRRLDYPVLHAPEGAYINTVPVRSIYPIEEQTLNGRNYDAASEAIGQDLMTTKLFWDLY